MHWRSGVPVAIAGVALLGGGPASAGAATTFGAGLTQAPNNSLSCDPACTGIIGSLESPAAAGFDAPTGGVVTRWRLRTEGQGVAFQTRLRVVRGDTGVASSDQVTIPTGSATNVFPTRVPVQADDRIGIEFPLGVEVAATVTPSDAGVIDGWRPPLADGETRMRTFSLPNADLQVNADLEPDADRDGFGDETQDCRPADSTSQCQPPETTITKAPKRTLAKDATKVKFSSDLPGSTFECKLDRKPFKACSSPRKLKNLDDGKHKFKVRAISASIVDPTPAKARFKVLD